MSFFNLFLLIFFCLGVGGGGGELLKFKLLRVVCS